MTLTENTILLWLSILSVGGPALLTIASLYIDRKISAVRDAILDAIKDDYANRGETQLQLATMKGEVDRLRDRVHELGNNMFIAAARKIEPPRPEGP